MSESFEKWYLNRYTSTDIHEVSGMQAAYTAGLLRAAEIVDKHATYSYSVGEHRNITDCATAIRKEAGE